MKPKPICFVIMGFGRKSDPNLGKSFDLDKTYKNIIKPSAEQAGFQVVRADEISDSAVIDKSMYALLMYADLVIADISTFNPNAIYELGIRHAVRPFSTVVLKKEDETQIPFDLSHTRIFSYKHLGDDIGVDEAKKSIESLIKIIRNATDNSIIDSPMYEYIKNIKYPVLSRDEYREIIGDLADRGDHIFGIVERAKHLMDEDNFLEAVKLWKKATSAVPNEIFFIQQLALSQYKSKEPSEDSSLTDALSTILKATIDGETNDPETLGIIGAIYKRKWLLSHDVEFLKRAEDYYSKGFQISDDYYTGENYALCLNMLGENDTDDQMKSYYNISANKTRLKIIENLQNLIDEYTEGNVSEDYKWAYATLSNSFYGVNEDAKGKSFEDAFLNYAVGWEKKTFLEGKEKLFKLLGK